MGIASLVDLGTRLFWRLVGRRVDLGGEHAWLDSVANRGPVVDYRWVDEYADRRGWQIGPTMGAGLLPSMDVLDGPLFDAAAVSQKVRDFYENTSNWRLDVWSQWQPSFLPAGALITLLFGRRVRQLALPVEPMLVAHGMTSRVTPLLTMEGRQMAAAWVRTLKATGHTVFSGCYAVGHLPGADQPLVHVTFPLESGNVQVYLTPSMEDGAFVLRSGKGRFGDPGAYVAVNVGGKDHAARVPLHETFRLFVDDEDVLRCDHELRLGRFRVLRLHYRMSRP